MPKTKVRPEILRRKERVKAAVDLRGVPEGTEGRVMFSNGVDWIRYWVSFDNGIDMGSLDRAKLVRPDEWQQYLVDREHRAELAASPDESGGSDDSAAEGGGAGAVVVNGVTVPQALLDRTKAALQRLGVSR